MLRKLHLRGSHAGSKLRSFAHVYSWSGNARNCSMVKDWEQSSHNQIGIRLLHPVPRWQVMKQNQNARSVWKQRPREAGNPCTLLVVVASGCTWSVHISWLDEAILLFHRKRKTVRLAELKLLFRFAHRKMWEEVVHRPVGEAGNVSLPAPTTVNNSILRLLHNVRLMVEALVFRIHNRQQL